MSVLVPGTSFLFRRFVLSSCCLRPVLHPYLVFLSQCNVPTCPYGSAPGEFLGTPSRTFPVPVTDPLSRLRSRGHRLDSLTSGPFAMTRLLTLSSLPPTSDPGHLRTHSTGTVFPVVLEGRYSPLLTGPLVYPTGLPTLRPLFPVSVLPSCLPGRSCPFPLSTLLLFDGSWTEN